MFRPRIDECFVIKITDSGQFLRITSVNPQSFKISSVLQRVFAAVEDFSCALLCQQNRGLFSTYPGQPHFLHCLWKHLDHLEVCRRVKRGQATNVLSVKPGLKSIPGYLRNVGRADPIETEFSFYNVPIEDHERDCRPWIGPFSVGQTDSLVRSE